jgi:hypothetical protein
MIEVTAEPNFVIKIKNKIEPIFFKFQRKDRKTI